MKKFIAGRVEVCLGYDFEWMNKYTAIEKCKELGSKWRLPNQKEIKYLCQNFENKHERKFQSRQTTYFGLHSEYLWNWSAYRYQCRYDP